METRRLFPLGKAYGKAFCNRVEETKKLIGNLESGKHTFLVAPRRYGKSSLCEQVFSKIDMPWTKLDFHLAVTEKDVERILLNGMSELIGKSTEGVDKLLHLIKKYTKKIKPKLLLETSHIKLELGFDQESSPAETIAEALLILENLLKEHKTQAVLLLDEFQEIGEMETGKAIEGAIRHVAQETQYLSLIFSGSNPHLLKTMFEDERRPLYKLCRKLVLDRMEEEDYRPHLNKAAKAKWAQEFSSEAFEKIMMITERHPYYVNYLCDDLWSENTNLPTVKEIDEAWDRIVEEEKSDLLKDFFSLAQNQRKLMIHLANNGGKNLYSNEVAQKINMGNSAITRSILILVERDYIEKVRDKYRLIVPCYKALLRI